MLPTSRVGLNLGASSPTWGIPFPTVMALTALFTSDPALIAAPQRLGGEAHPVAVASSWTGFLRLVRERPVTAAVLDASAVVPGGQPPEDALSEFRSLYPNLSLILLSRCHNDPVWLFQLGRAEVRDLILLDIEDLARSGPRALDRASERGATAVVTREMSPYLPGRGLNAVRIAMDGVHRRWSTDAFAAAVGLSRPFLSERLKECGLPSAGHLLIWTRLLHAGFWLEEPGRTGESVSRQLEYSSGAAFRRALKLYTGATPTEVTREGGLSFVLGRLFEACGLGRGTRVTAA